MTRDRSSAAQGLALATVAIMLLLAMIGALASVGSASAADAAARFAFVTRTMAVAGTIIAVWLLAALGWGCLWVWERQAARHPQLLRLAAGVATLLWLAHLLAWTGVGTTRTGAVAPSIAGIAVLGARLRSEKRSRAGSFALSPIAFVATPALAILTVAAASWPGWLWESEAFGYDVLEYHLQLPAEWLREGALRGLAHNGHSFMPNYVEAAFLQLAAPWGSMHALGGAPMLHAQMLHAGLTVATAVGIGACVAGIAGDRAGVDPARRAGWLAAVWFLGVPWTQVVGSMAYDEMAIALLFLGALAALGEEGLSWERRSALAGWMGAGAVCAKLTAIFVVLLPVAAMILMRVRPSRWTPVGAAGVAASVLMVLPYLARNFLATGNPVFPFGTSFFGAGHWTSDQLAQWNRMLTFHGGAIDRLAAVGDALTHPQWSIGLWTGGTALLLGSIARETRRTCLLFAVGLVLALGCWALWTHVLARYLVPWLVPLAITVGVVAARAERSAARPARIAWAAACLLLGGLLVRDSLVNFLSQRGGDPSAFASPIGYELRTGRYLLEQHDDPARAPVISHVNHLLPEPSLVYVVGESRVLYVRKPVLYSAPFDVSPLGRLVRDAPGDPARWRDGLVRLGVTHVWVSWGELERLLTSGFSDPELTPERIAGFLHAFARRLAGSESSELYELVPGSGAS